MLREKQTRPSQLQSMHHSPGLAVAIVSGFSRHGEPRFGKNIFSKLVSKTAIPLPFIGNHCGRANTAGYGDEIG
jgi:hypothetical protein